MIFAATFCQQAATMSGYKFMPRAVASPDALQKPLVRKRARSGVATWVQVTRRKTLSTTEWPQTTGSQQPACNHEERQIPSASEVAALQRSFGIKRRTRPRLLSMNFWLKKFMKKYVPNNKHGDVCPNGVPALPEKDDANDDSE